MKYEVVTFNHGGYDTLKTFDHASDATNFARSESRKSVKPLQVFKQIDDDDFGMYLVTEYENGKRMI